MGSHGCSGHAPAQPAHRTYRRPLRRPSDRLVAAGHRTRRILSHTAAIGAATYRPLPDLTMSGRFVWLISDVAHQVVADLVEQAHPRMSLPCWALEFYAGCLG